ncbi:hypothetical protein VF14_16965 [Nostoc linckia z18]|uniref:Uncharacterized protein n=2 Tax=Nostoc linckia TaxID=92942 RepID=A0A9Q5ZE58_NOSLI|nr:hypothetical protein VF02_16550 [Nostoc linckia z1]PHJ66592.1 hypothetical protein VF05_18825 [Nostoc linckia z3]PHJ72713.1 hypothetical protein VF03_17925 [Nostoc linckia z2]PHJ80892.1 hypothetical protein VF06_21115 [Nostoc linckia z4]PHJ87244.1 hypothetical protein VF07_21015 [Nostoc linckia z6]PHJ95133.1 hypothetical protein VF04_19935 [Nostoc linckia z7]PHK03609.1 hypothetical protein VF09_29725 [Nostoc linckia z9]PHK05259.1 hypothetical protein VF08_08720 [Nostoc linckia z8]PHK2008
MVWEKVSQRGLGGFPHERLALASALATKERHPEGVKGQGDLDVFETFPRTLLTGNGEMGERQTGRGE